MTFADPCRGESHTKQQSVLSMVILTLPAEAMAEHNMAPLFALFSGSRENKTFTQSLELHLKFGLMASFFNSAFLALL